MDQARLYQVRFDPVVRKRKARVWRVLCRSFFQRYVDPEDAVLDIGAGYCEFINHIRCRRKIALDPSPDTRRFAAVGVEVIEGTAMDLRVLEEGSLDVAFASNFFEHLRSKDEVLATMSEVRRVLRPGGRLLILQPNIRYVGGAYWDFFDHHLPLTERALVEALGLAGLDAIEVRPRFLPFTTKSALPQHPFLVWLYLKVPLAHRILGAQAWIVAVRPAT